MVSLKRCNPTLDAPHPKQSGFPQWALLVACSSPHVTRHRPRRTFFASVRTFDIRVGPHKTQLARSTMTLEKAAHAAIQRAMRTMGRAWERIITRDGALGCTQNIRRGPRGTRQALAAIRKCPRSAWGACPTHGHSPPAADFAPRPSGQSARIAFFARCRPR